MYFKRQLSECGLSPVPAVELIRSLNRLNFQVAASGSAVNVDKNEIVKLLNTKYGCEKKQDNTECMCRTGT